jgi:hypothetical protein
MGIMMINNRFVIRIEKVADKRWRSAQKDRRILKVMTKYEKREKWQPQHLTSILAQWRHYPRLKMCVELQVYRLQESTWKPPLPQYATTLGANGGQRNRKGLKINMNNRSERAE